MGVDVTRFEPPVKGNAEFFATMKKQFTAKEWLVIGGSLELFYRHWALKESLVKEMGIGLGFDLQRANFIMDGPGRARVEIDGVLDEDRSFEIIDLDDMHCVAMCWTRQSGDVEGMSFERMSVPELIEKVKTLI